MRALALLVVSLAWTTPPQQSGSPAAAPRDSVIATRRERLTEFLARERAAGRDSDQAVLPAAPAVSGIAALDSAVRLDYVAALRAYYQYRKNGLDHRRRVFEWQLWSSQVIFFVVILLVGAGIAFSGAQFYKSLRSSAAPEVTQLEASIKGVKVTSSVLGVVILSLSFLFFYLYLVHVYPIHEAI